MSQVKAVRETSQARKFEELLHEHQSMVFSIALRLLRDHSLAEELAQDVFLQLHQKMDELESDAHVKFWLRRVTCHRAIDEIRRRRLRPRTGLESAPEPSLMVNHGDVLMRAGLRRLVAGLPEKARAVVVLRFQEDMDPIEISRVLEMPASSVKSLLHRTLALLRGKVERAGLVAREVAR